VGRAQLRRDGGSGLAILAFGTMVTPAEKLGERFDATVVNMRFVKPLDTEMLGRLVKRHTAIVTLEENAVRGGAGSAVAEALHEAGVTIPMLTLGIPDRFIEHGSREECLAMAGLDLPQLEAAIESFWNAPGLGRVAHESA
jgi:1-deoxy-D-xylulose-5-phosphate synthase